MLSLNLKTMKQSIMYWRYLAALWCCLCSIIQISAQVQNTYSLGINHDHYSIIESTGTPGNLVMAGTLYNNGNNDIHVLEVDALGNIVWEASYDAGADDRAFHIASEPSGYVVSGFNNVAGQRQALVLQLDLIGNIVNQVNIADQTLGYGARALHITPNVGAQGGYAIAGWLGGEFDTDPKVAWIAQLDGSLNVMWETTIDSPALANDFDMGNHVLEVPGKGYFLSGSVNRATGEQHVLGAMLDYGGNVQWIREYSDNPSGGHYSVAASAYYCPQRDAIFQLSNLSIIHHFGVNVFDVSTGARDNSRSWRIFSQFGFANIQGFKIMEANNPNNIIIAGYNRDIQWQERDIEGQLTGNMQSGSAPFMMEIVKDIPSTPTPIVWDQFYHFPSPNYFVGSDIYDAFIAGQQPRINHPEMAINRAGTNGGYDLVGYRQDAGGPYELEMMASDAIGKNICGSDPLGFSLTQVQWNDQQNADPSLSNSSFQTAQNSRITVGSVIDQCSTVTNPPCDIIPDFTFDPAECTVHFTAINNGTTPLSDLCYSWDFGDGSPISNAVNPVHVYSGTGVYTVCLEIWCCNDPSSKITICHEVTVDCPSDCEPPVPGFDIFCEDGILTLTATNNGNPVDDSLYCWEWEDGTANTEQIVIQLPNPCPTSWGHCITMWCCDDPDNAQTVCIDFLLDCCPNECEPLSQSDIDFTYGPSNSGICPDGCSIGFNCPVLDPDKYCVLWEFGDGTIFTNVNSCPIHCFPCSGVYDVCLTVYCCEDPSISTQVCKAVEVNCCTLPTDIDLQVSLNAQEECKVDVAVELPADVCPENYCYEVDMGDGTIVSNNLNFTHDYSASGDYTVCLNVYCCDDPSQVLTVCREINVQCEPCVLPSSIGFTYQINDNCEACFIPFVTDDYEGIMCSQWWINGAYAGGTDFLLDYCHQFDQSGTYEVCYRVCCCEDESMYIEYCETIEINCCQAPADFEIEVTPSQTVDCQVGFCLSNYDLDPHIYCATWDFGDGTVADFPVNVCPIHLYECSGDYEVCATVYCCDDPSVSTTVCKSITVECDGSCCVEPEPFEILYMPNTNPDNCEQGFCLSNFNLDPSKYCATWDFGDGHVQDFPINVCPVHSYTDCGSYVVCATVYCCDDPSKALTTCIDIVVDCNSCCETPEAFEIETYISTDPDDCSVGFCLSNYNLDPNKYCATWDFGDGTTQDFPVNVCPQHFYECDGDYEVCATVYCCDDPTKSNTVCMDITVDCPCKLPQAGIDVNKGVGPDGECYATLEFIQNGSGCPDDFCYSVNWGDGTVNQATTHNFSANGTYQVCVDVFCCDDPSIGYQVCEMVLIDCHTACDVNANFTCTQAGHAFSFTDLSTSSGSTNIVSWFWTFGDGNTSNLQNPTHTYVNSGTYTICLTVIGVDASGNQCEDTFCVTKQVDCPEPCEVHAVFIPQMIGDCSVQFFNQSYVGVYTTLTGVQWNFGDGTTSTSSNPAHTFPGSGTYTVCLTIFGSSAEGQCENQFCWDVTVECEEPCEVLADFVYDQDDCDVYFVNTSSTSSLGTTTYTWDFGDGNTSTDNNPVHTYVLSGTYTVCLTAVHTMPDGSVCIDVKCIEIQVDCYYNEPCDFNAKFKVKRLEDCTFEFLDITWVNAGLTIIDWQWDFGDGTTSNLQNPTHTFPGSGTYTVCLTVTVTNGVDICTDTICRTRFIECECSCENLDLQMNVIVTPDCEVILEDVTVYPDCIEVKDRKWRFGDGQGSYVTPVVAHTYDAPGVYEVCLMVVTHDGQQYCQHEICQEVYVDCPGFIGSEAPNNSQDVSNGFDALPQVSIFPNPSNGLFNASIDDGEITSIIVRDLSGREVQRIENINQHNAEVNLSNEEGGTYIVELYSGEQSVRKRIIIQ